MGAAAIVQLIASVGLPLAEKILERYSKSEPADVVASEWLSYLKELKSYNELRAEKVKTSV